MRFNSIISVTVAVCALLLMPTGSLAMPVTDVHVFSFGDYAFFGLKFEGLPDFFTVDEVGRQQDEFQFYISAINPIEEGPEGFSRAAAGVYPDDGLSIIRGAEIYQDGKIVIVDVEPFWVPAPGESTNGGWGPVVEEVDFIQGFGLGFFAVPLEAIKSETGHFNWLLLTLHFGDSDNESFILGSSNVLSVPEPTTLSLFSAGLLAMCVRRGRKARV